MSKIRAIIPAAGFGTRVGMSSNESKEFLIDPVTNKPVIQWHLDLCKQYSLDPLVIVRQEKKDLVNYLKDQDVDYMIIDEVKGEWPDTILASESRWYDVNILLLPDTRFQPLDIIYGLSDDLRNNQCVFAVHDVDDPTKWGIIEVNNDTVSYAEKPSYSVGRSAWGLIGFKREIGAQLFNNMKQRSEWHIGSLNEYSIVKLNWFKDITRNGKVESY